MRRHFQMAAVAVFVAGALMCSCDNEKEVADVQKMDPQSLSLVMEVVSTRAADTAPVSTFEYPLDLEVDGRVLCLEETVTEMGNPADAFAPGTRGTPIFSENVRKFYGTSFNGLVKGTSDQVVAEDGTFTLMDDTADENRWQRYLGFDPWETSDPLTFFLRMPATQPGVSNLTYTNSSTVNSVAFDFTTPASASEQKDILFATRRMTKAEYETEFYSANGGASVLFRHALTGVKFSIANNTSQNGIRTFISEVSITGLKDKGHAVFVPDNTSEQNVDNANTFSSKSSFTWTDVAATARTAKYTQAFTEQQILDYASGDAVSGPASFYTNGEGQNLNDANASLTFWFIPQEITADVKLSVKVYLKDGEKKGETHTLELELGSEILKQVAAGRNTNKEWKAGQLRTFTLKPNKVDVDITDKVEGFTKSDVKIRNTGNVDAFIRAGIAANWFGSMANGKDGIALGYTSATSNEFVKSWQMETATTDNYGGTFTRLPGTGWEKATDGYFYYTSPVAPGAYTGTPLFLTYSLDTSVHPVPAIWYFDHGRKEFTNVRLVMEIPVQAIEAKAGKTYIQAWADAGVTVTVTLP